MGKCTPKEVEETRGQLRSAPTLVGLFVSGHLLDRVSEAHLSICYNAYFLFDFGFLFVLLNLQFAQNLRLFFYFFRTRRRSASFHRDTWSWSA